jgi:hypothetical protein
MTQVVDQWWPQVMAKRLHGIESPTAFSNLSMGPSSHPIFFNAFLLVSSLFSQFCAACSIPLIKAPRHQALVGSPSSTFPLPFFCSVDLLFRKTYSFFYPTNLGTAAAGHALFQYIDILSTNRGWSVGTFVYLSSKVATNSKGWIITGQ